jgi:hypothetical protein
MFNDCVSVFADQLATCWLCCEPVDPDKGSCWQKLALYAVAPLEVDGEYPIGCLDPNFHGFGIVAHDNGVTSSGFRGWKSGHLTISLFNSFALQFGELGIHLLNVFRVRDHLICNCVH